MASSKLLNQYKNFIKIHIYFFLWLTLQTPPLQWGVHYLLGDKTTQPAYYKVNVQLPGALLHRSVIHIVHFTVLHLPGINNFGMMRGRKNPTCSDSQEHIIFNTPAHMALPKISFAPRLALSSEWTGSSPILNGRKQFHKHHLCWWLHANTNHSQQITAHCSLLCTASAKITPQQSHNSEGSSL